MNLEYINQRRRSARSIFLHVYKKIEKSGKYRTEEKKDFGKLRVVACLRANFFYEVCITSDEGEILTLHTFDDRVWVSAFVCLFSPFVASSVSLRFLLSLR